MINGRGISATATARLEYLSRLPKSSNFNIGLLRVCQQIVTEASGFLYTGNKFQFTLCYDVHGPDRYVRSVWTHRYLRPLRSAQHLDLGIGFLGFQGPHIQGAFNNIGVLSKLIEGGTNLRCLRIRLAHLSPATPQEQNGPGYIAEHIMRQLSQICVKGPLVLSHIVCGPHGGVAANFQAEWCSHFLSTMNGELYISPLGYSY